jgi:phage major head subunit gpT-like protein
MLTGAYSQSWDRELRKQFFHEYTIQPKEYTQIAKMDPMDGAYDKEGELAGLTQLNEMHEGQEIRFEDFEQGNTKEMTPKKFGLGVQITEEMIDDDRFGHMKKAMKELGRAANYAEELEFWDLLNNGFVTTYHSGIDSKALFAADHATIKGGGTIDNDGTDASLTVTSLQEALTYFESLVNEVNVPIVARADLLVIPAALRYKAEKLLLSEYDPENANSQYNTVGNRGIQFMIGHYLTSSTAWFVLSKDLHDLRFRWRKKIQFDRSTDFHTGNYLYKATGRFLADFVHYRGAFGNSGA